LHLETSDPGPDDFNVRGSASNCARDEWPGHWVLSGVYDPLQLNRHACQGLNVYDATITETAGSRK
jgi:hypothetical protein